MKGYWIWGARRLMTGLLLGGTVAVVSACGRGEASEAPAVQTTEVVRETMRITAEATGQVEPVRQVEVKSKASGEILRLHADIGDRVEPGTLLAEIDPRDVQNAFDQAEADLEVAQARVDISEAQLERSTELLEAGVITQQEFESQRLDYANSRASLVKAQTNLELAQLRLSDVTIRAPIAGTILTRNVEEGTVIQSASSNVSGGSILFVMANLDEMQVRTLVDETDMGQVKAGLTASVQVEAFPGRSFEGVVEKIEPQATVQQNVTMFPVIVRLDNRQGLLRPGMNAEVETLLVERPDVLVVPNNAVVLPQEMMAAASVLGLDGEAIEFDQAVYAEMARAAGLGAMRGGGRTRNGVGGGTAGQAAGRGAQDPSQPGGTPPEGAARPEAPVGMEGFRARMDSLRAQVERGEISQDSMDAVRNAFRAQMGGQAGGAPGAQGAAVVQDANPALSGLVNTTGAPRPAVAFVVLADGSTEMRPVLMGVNDWDNTEILAGLQEGEQVALIGAAQLQAEQQQMMNRMRGMGGMFGPGMRR
ncbi:MAG: efflux RND transporter periplasmic adaptor subunit [Longimicrobiales bacterium]